MVLLSVLAAVSKIALRFNLNGHVVAFREDAEDRHVKAAFELSEHPFEKTLQTLLVVGTGHWRQLGLSWYPPRHVVPHQREHAWNVACVEACEELYGGALVVVSGHDVVSDDGSDSIWRLMYTGK